MLKRIVHWNSGSCSYQAMRKLAWPAQVMAVYLTHGRAARDPSSGAAVEGRQRALSHNFLDLSHFISSASSSFSHSCLLLLALPRRNNDRRAIKFSMRDAEMTVRSRRGGAAGGHGRMPRFLSSASSCSALSNLTAGMPTVSAPSTFACRGNAWRREMVGHANEGCMHTKSASAKPAR